MNKIMTDVCYDTDFIWFMGKAYASSFFFVSVEHDDVQSELICDLGTFLP